jgi:hypothetical protein
MDNPEVLLGLITLHRGQGVRREPEEAGGEKRGQEGHRRAARKGHTLKRTLGNRKPRVTHGHTLV